MEPKNNDIKIDLKLTEKLILSFGLGLVAFMFVLDYTIANVAVPYIAGGLGVSSSEGTYTITFFSVGNAIFLPMTSWLVKRYGDDKVIVAATFLFTFFSFTCACAPGLYVLVLSRFLQGASAGPLIPLAQGILTKLFREQVDKIAIFFSLIIMVAPVVGPVVGGYICINYTWRWIFYINIPFGAISTIILIQYLKKIQFPKKKLGFDWVTFLLLLVGMTSLQIFLDKGQQWDWEGSIKVRVLSVIASISIIYILVWSFTYKEPLFKLSLFKNRLFAACCILIFLAYSLYFATVVIVPFWLEEILGYTAFKAGLAVAPMGVGALLGVLLIGRIIAKYPFWIFISLGFLFMASSCFYSAKFLPDVSFFHVGFSRFFLGLGLSMWIVPVMGLIADCLPSDDLDAGLSIFHFLRSLSGGIGTSIYMTLYIRRGYHQHANFVGTFNEYREVCREYYNDILNIIPNQESATYLLGQELNKQAATFAFCELNKLMGWICIALILVSFLTIQKKSVSTK